MAKEKTTRSKSGDPSRSKAKPVPIATGIEQRPTKSPAERLAARESSQDETSEEFLASVEDRRAAETLVRHLFAQEGHRIDGVKYSVRYKLAGGSLVGGDIVDVYHFDNGNVAFSIADVSGKGTQAAIFAALIKYGLRCYASGGLTPESTMRALDRVFIENNAFERTDQFASAFFGVVDQQRRTLTYANAGHEPVVIVPPKGKANVLAPTAPLVGVFDDQHHLFRQKTLDLAPGTLLVATTDGVTEARSNEGVFYGIERFTASARRHRSRPVADITERVLRDAERFATGVLRDDIAVLAVLFE